VHLNSLEITLVLCSTPQIAYEIATIVKLKSGNYCVQIRHKGQYASKTFSNKFDAPSWSFEADRRSNQGRGIITPKITGFVIFGQLIELHTVDMIEVDKPLGRSKDFALRTLNKNISVK